MALENLKSAFNDIRPFSVEDSISGNSKIDIITKYSNKDATSHDDIITPIKRTNLSDQTAFNSRYDNLVPMKRTNLSDQTTFNSRYDDIPGVNFDGGFLRPETKFEATDNGIVTGPTPILSTFSTIDIETRHQSLTAQKLGFGDFEPPDINKWRSSLGTGAFSTPKTKLQVSGPSGMASVFYINTPTGDVIGASGAISKFGKISDKLSSVGIDTPNLPFDVSVTDIFKPKEIIYQDSVHELLGGTTSDMSSADSEKVRGIAWQAFSPPMSKKDALKFMDTPLPAKPWIETGIRSPIAGFESGNIKFKDTSALLDFSGIEFESRGGIFDSLGNFIAENKMIQGFGAALGGAFSSLSGFGKKISIPSLPKIPFPSMDLGGMLGGISDTVGNIASAVAGGTSVLAGGIKEGVSALAKTASKLNPIDELTLPKIQLQNPFVNPTIGGTAGGKGMLRENNPRSDKMVRPFTRRLAPPKFMTEGGDVTGTLAVAASGGTKTWDRFYEEGGASTPYKDLGKLGSEYAKHMTDFYPNRSMGEGAGGDMVTLSPLLTQKELDADSGEKDKVEELISEKHGYPVYFKDLRDNTYIFFRGYIDGLQDNHKADWSPETYIGRSEPVFTYKGGTRSISFNLSMYAQTALELDAIYTKLRRLVSLCWPEYKNDTSFGQKFRMKPPLVTLRIGDLFGNQSIKSKTGSDLMGFLESVNVSWDDKSPWEFRYGQRVPKYVKTNLSFQPIHDRPPDHMTQFYGYASTGVNEDLKKNFGASESPVL